ncbi:DUF4129 domain-containing protein [Zobellia galactanivorans]|uniref:Conserved hypothetical membrane protein n=1 Tax=Zobellia galactanivorans (strain DSM 12802 / CCUG 47099 / CIP 106680 / NCIMB 13871 / Dsij) TaxID=63186 RepID=G0L9I7_ZOBGA|nr:DUF4129 domain-containing protein [Zobellia galactanivorans]MBU3026948.1 DUF4129 domain-containing protein [Zobellia galactanivorans]MDO6810212.1 DUF4129 domain-containing protein [Zobellia galactanivorans]CAZ94612.1 Conserved hypothetical membrane protein [Zobellia galactanivorans]
MPKTFFFFCFALCCSMAFATPQDSLKISYDSEPLKVKKISDADLLPYQNDKAFNYETFEAEATWWDDFKSWLGNLMLRTLELIFGVGKASGILAGLIRLAPYLLLGLLIYILIRFFLNINARALQEAQKNQSLVSISEEEHIIKNENIHDLIQQALSKNDFRLAVRYSYLHLLKLMSEKELIAWEPQKTNDDYLREISKSDLKDPFTHITRLYNFTWYGDFPIDETGYQRARQTFLSIEKSVQKNG